LHREPFRYVDEAVFYLVERYRRIGITPQRLTVKVFGGADVLGEPVRGYSSIGHQNTMAARETLGWQDLRIAARDTGGDRGRKIVFRTHTGEVFVRQLGTTSSRSVARREKARE
jgi:chemotaxis protein CheD